MHRGIVLWRDPNHLLISTCTFSQNYLALPSFEVRYVEWTPFSQFFNHSQQPAQNTLIALDQYIPHDVAQWLKL